MSPTGSNEGVDREFSRTFAALPEIFAFTEAFYGRAGIGKDDRLALDFAIEELFTNCVKYGGASSAAVTLRLEMGSDEVRVTIVDPDTHPFDPTVAPDVRTDAALDERRPGGLGIHLTRRLMDGVTYAHSGRTGTITLTRRLR